MCSWSVGRGEERGTQSRVEPGKEISGRFFLSWQWRERVHEVAKSAPLHTQGIRGKCGVVMKLEHLIANLGASCYKSIYNDVRVRAVGSMGCCLLALG